MKRLNCRLQQFNINIVATTPNDALTIIDWIIVRLLANGDELKKAIQPMLLQ